MENQWKPQIVNWYIVTVRFADRADLFMAVGQGASSKQAMWSVSLRYGHDWGDISAIVISPSFATEADAMEQLPQTKPAEPAEVPPVLDAGFFPEIREKLENSG